MTEIADKRRLDICVMEMRGFSRDYAQEVILKGLVLVGGKVSVKPGLKVGMEDIDVLAPDMPFVSRGGFKLEAALVEFGISVSGKVCADVGASAGGFTDCMLKRGARRIYAIDVGKGQLAHSLRGDGRVISMEGTDIRGLTLPEPVDFAAADVSFISLGKVAVDIKGLLKRGAGIVCLIKPEFETGGRYLNKKGVVVNAAERRRAAEGAVSAMKSAGFEVLGMTVSPITGKNGNVEYLLYCINGI